MKTATREGPAVRRLAEVDPATGALVLDGSGSPALVPHYNAREAAPYLGLRATTIRDMVRSGELHGLLHGPRQTVLLTERHIALNLQLLVTNIGLAEAMHFDSEHVQPLDAEEGEQ